MPLQPAPPPAADHLTSREADGLGELLAALVLGREPGLADSADAVRATVQLACQREDESARRRGVGLVLAATSGLNKPPLTTLVGGLADLLDARFSDDEALRRLHDELERWVWWYRLPGYALAFALQQVTQRRGSWLHPLACVLYGQAQIALDEDLYLHSIENAYRPLAVMVRDHGQTAYEKPARIAESLLRACWEFHRTWSTDFPYESCNPLADHLYSALTRSRLQDAFPDLDLDRSPREALEMVVAECDSAEFLYWRVLARRFLGLFHAGTGELDAALIDYRLALKDAESAGLDTEIGHLRRLYGFALDEVERFDEAEAVLIRAVDHEQSALLFYWYALSAYRLADVRTHAALDRWQRTRDPALLMSAVRAYQSGREHLSLHLTGSVVPVARAVKVQQMRSYNDNALEIACLAMSAADILAQAEFNGPRESAELLADVAGAAAITEPMDADSFRQSIPGFLRHLGCAPADFEQYLAAVIDENQSRQIYYRNRNMLVIRGRGLQPADVAARLQAIRRDGQILIVIEPGPGLGKIVCLDLESGMCAPYDCELSRDRVRELHGEFSGALAAVARHPQPWRQLDSAVKRLLAGYQEALGPWLDQIARFLDGRAITFFPGRQVAAVPLHALNAGGRTLAEICPVGYGQTLGGFLSLMDRSAQASASEVTMVYDDLGARAFEPLAAAFPGSPSRRVTVMRNPPLDQLAAAVQSAPADQGRARDLFFACHGTFEPEDPVASSLLLHRTDVAIPLADVLARLNLRGWRSVVLGACETGQARSEIAAEYLGLANAFLAAGAAYVVGSLWKAHPLCTSLLFERYFSHLDEADQGPRQALQRAQADLIALTRSELEAWIGDRLPGVSAANLISDLQEHPFAGPAFWAAFSVSGAL